MSATETDETVDLDVDLDKPIPCSGVQYPDKEVRQTCDREAEFRLTFRCCRTVTRHKCYECTELFSRTAGYPRFVCMICGQLSTEMTVSPLS